MGVLTCNRKGCGHIMCDMYVPGIGYICHDCQQQFKKYLINQGMNPVNELQMESALKMFLDEDAGDFIDQENAMDVDDFFKQYTKRY